MTNEVTKRSLTCLESRFSSGRCLAASKWQRRDCKAMSNLAKVHWLFAYVSLAPCHAAVGLDVAWADVALSMNFPEVAKLPKSLMPKDCKVHRAGCVLQLPSRRALASAVCAFDIVSIINTLTKVKWIFLVTETSLSVTWVGGGQKIILLSQASWSCARCRTWYMEGLLVFYHHGSMCSGEHPQADSGCWW